MLPKVATTILHTTTRAVTSIQHQSYTIRNVLQGQTPSSNSGITPWSNPSSSHWGNNGPGPGSAKYNTGSRYNGYTGAGRAVTQANATISSNDGSFTQSDDQEELPTRRPAVSSTRRSRIRSSSLSIPSQGRNERGESLGVLKAVQIHARSRHAFASQIISSTSVEEPIPTTPRPVLVRRNSTSAPPPTQVFDPTIPAPTPKSSRRNSLSTSPASPKSLNTDPASPQTVASPQSPRSDISRAAKLLIAARETGDALHVAEAVRNFRLNTLNPSVREYNAALEALLTTRRPGEPLNLMLETYNDMLRHSLLPNVPTYVSLIDALTTRDQEVHNAITALQSRLKHQTLSGMSDPASETTDRKRIEVLHRENNFGTAMSLFETILTMGGNNRLSPHIYASLLRSCAIHSNIDAAIHVFAQQEKRTNMQPSAFTFLEMIRTYTNAGQLSGAEELFAEFRACLKRGGLHIDWAHDNADPNRGPLFIYNQMIETYFRFDMPEKAIGIVEMMLDSKPDAGTIVADPPPVSTATFTTVIAGFCQSGDVATALVWFDRLLAQQSSSDDPYEATGAPMKPDNTAWSIMLDALAAKGMVDDLNRLFSIRLQDQRVSLTERFVVFSANIANVLTLDDTKFKSTLDFLHNSVFAPGLPLKERKIVCGQIADAYLDRKMYNEALDVLSEYFTLWLKAQSKVEGRSPALQDVEDLQLKFAQKLYKVSQGSVPYAVTMELARVAGTVRIMQPPEYIPFFLQSYALTRASETLPVTDMTLRDWELLLMAATEFEYASLSKPDTLVDVPEFAFQGLASLLRDFATYNVPLRRMNDVIVRHTIKLLTQRLGQNDTTALLNEVGFLLNDSNRPAEALQKAIEDDSTSVSASDSGYASSVTNSDGPLPDDGFLSRGILTEFRVGRLDASTSYYKLRASVDAGRAPNAIALGALIQTFGRAGLTGEMAYAYAIAQRVLLGMTGAQEKSDGWFNVENSMIIGHAHSGDVESAHVHRHRILKQGGAPDANAYGALIYNVKETTDDASNALALFHEAQTHRVPPNPYLFNNIISKLAKARKADYAMELFQQMKALGISPSSVTFGAVIGACARVGDVRSAEMLYSEMTEDENFKPRIPPFNMMMQLYTTTKPDRDRVLFFYNEMRRYSIKPSAHTYKLLLDAYGSIEPVDIAGMEQTCEALKAQPNALQCTHYASLINAYGCVSKDLDKAIDIFNTMAIPADAVVYEIMMNVFVVHRRTDLMQEYIDKMNTAGVHMTAYIANSLIKGYAIVDDIQQARVVFECLDDPPQGVAAPNNHAPHSPSEAAPAVDRHTYREPSTWEAMIRAELGSGNRDAALDLLARLQARQYPEAVYNRISGILVDHSQIPL